RDHHGKIAPLQQQEDQAEYAGDQQEELGPQLAARLGRHCRHAAGEAREEQNSGLDRDARRVEELASMGTVGGRRLQNGVCCEEGGKHDDVAEQKYPEAITYDDALGSRAPFAMTPGKVAPSIMVVAYPVRVHVPPGIQCKGIGGAHAVAPARAACASHSSRARRRARSRRATSSAGTTYSSTSRHAN